MRRLLIGLLVMTLTLTAGCGGAPKQGDAARSSGTSQERDDACAAGDGHLQVSDILDRAPPGLEIVEADREALRPIMEPLRRALGDRLRGFATKAVVRRGTTEGTAIIIANANESIGEPDEVLDGARQSAEDNDGRFEEITVADKPAGFVDYGQVFQISVQVGDCAVATLIDADGRRIRDVADALHAPS